MQHDHKCPRKGCRIRVANYRFACRADWYELSTRTKNLIRATAGLNVLDPERRRAFGAAEHDWGRTTLQ